MGEEKNLADVNLKKKSKFLLYIFVGSKIFPKFETNISKIVTCIKGETEKGWSPMY